MDKIAIIGMGCLFPDYAHKEKFWHTILHRGSFLCQDQFLDKTIERGGVPFSGTEFFAEYYSSEELEELESFGELYKWCAYIIDQSLKDAGYTAQPSKLERTGLIVGSVGQTTRDQIDFLGPFVTKNLEREINQIVGGDQFKYTFTPQLENLHPDSILADTRPIQYLAKKRGIKGPVVSFNAACASPLYALRLAGSYLNAGEVDMVIAGSQCYNETIGGIFGLFSKFGILCDIGESKPLDRDSKGLIPGSGAGLFVLKRLADATRDGDKILAVIESIGWSNDGGTSSGIMTPSTKGQVKALESAYENGLSREIDYIECHATGTEAGDQVEIKSLEEFFGFAYMNGPKTVSGRPLLGGLKGSTGHFFTATACASIAKVIMAMEHEVLPATIGIENPICEGLVLENTPWKAGKKPRRAGINAFGFGGINAHLVLSDYCALGEDREGVSREDIAEGLKKCSDVDEPSNKRFDVVKTEMAIIGMGFKIGGFGSVEEFLAGLEQNKDAFTSPDQNRFRGYDQDPQHLLSHGFEELPKGSYISKFRFDAMRFKMPISGNPFFLRRDMMVLETVAEALDGAGIKRGEAERTAVIAHSTPDYSDPLFMATYEIDESIRRSLAESYPELTTEQQEQILQIMREDEAQREHVDNVPGMIGNIRGNRISAHWGFFGPSLTVLENETSIFRGLELARFFLSEDIVEQVVIVASLLTGEFEHLYAQKELGVLDLMKETGIAEGVVALVLKRKDVAIKDNDTIYSIVKGVGLSSAGKEMTMAVDDVLNQIFSQGRIGKEMVQAVEIPASYNLAQQNIIEKICKERYQKHLAKEVTISNVEQYLGFGFSLSAAASVVRHALQLYLSRVFTPGTARQMESSTGKKAMSLVTGYTLHGNFGCAVLEQYQNNKSKGEKKLMPSRLIPLPIPFSSKETLLKNLDFMEGEISKKSTLKSLHQLAWSNYQKDNPSGSPQMGRGIVILCDSKETLGLEIEQFRVRMRQDANFLEPVMNLKALEREPFFKEKSTTESRAFFCDKYGLPADVIRHLGLGDALVRYQPTSYLLKLGARLMFEGIAFDYHKFFKNFDFYTLKQPSFIREISTGMPPLYKRVDSPENRRILGAIKKQLGKKSRVSFSPLALPAYAYSKQAFTQVELRDFYENTLSFKPEVGLIREVVEADLSPSRESLGKITAKLEIGTGYLATWEKAQEDSSVLVGMLSEGVDQMQALHAMGRGYFVGEDCQIETNQGLWSWVEEPPLFLETIFQEASLREEILLYELEIKSICENKDTVSIISDCEMYLQGLRICKVKEKQFVIKIATA